jgi:hypothetical protein
MAAGVNVFRVSFHWEGERVGLSMRVCFLLVAVDFARIVFVVFFHPFRIAPPTSPGELPPSSVSLHSCCFNLVQDRLRAPFTPLAPSPAPYDPPTLHPPASSL